MANLNKKVKSTQDKIAEITAKFDAAEEILSPEIVETVQTETQQIEDEKEKYDPIDVMSLKQMADDFKYSGEILREVIGNGRMVLEKATQELMLAEDSKYEDTTAFAELTTAVLNGVKVHSQLYKDFSNVLLNIKKIYEGTTPKTVTNNLTIHEDISTVDIIERLKKLDKPKKT